MNFTFSEQKVDIKPRTGSILGVKGLKSCSVKYPWEFLCVHSGYVCVALVEIQYIHPAGLGECALVSNEKADGLK